MAGTIMTTRRWWDVAVVSALVVIIVFAVLVYDEGSAQDQLIGAAAAVAVGIAYALLARPEIACEHPDWRTPAFIAVAAIALCVAVSVNPFLTMLQTIVYPLVWVITGGRRGAIIGTLVMGAAVLVGFLIHLDFTAEGLVSGLTTAGFSIVFAIVFGLWIASIAEYGDERARLLAELTAAQSQVEALSRDRGAAQERERLAREIHDTLAQTLAGLVLIAERAGRQSREGQTDAAAASIARVEQVARDALAESRALVARTAAVPSEPAFEAAVERLIDRFRVETGLRIDVSHDGATPEFGRDAQVVVLRCLQEGLANVRKHAGAAHVVVRVTAVDGGVMLEISDDGRGFDPASAHSGFGLDGMGDRLALAGGALEVDAAPGHGTTLRARVPATSTAGGAA